MGWNKRRWGGRGRQSKVLFVRPRMRETFGDAKVTDTGMVLNNVSWTNEAAIFDGAALGTSFFGGQSAQVRKILLQLACTVIVGTVQCVYRLLTTVYIKDSDDTSIYNVNGATAFATDKEDSIIFQDSRDVVQTGATSGVMLSYSTPDNPWLLNIRTNRRITRDQKLVLHIQCIKANPNWGALTGVDLVNFNSSGRVWLSTRKPIL